MLWTRYADSKIFFFSNTTFLFTRLCTIVVLQACALISSFLFTANDFSLIHVQSVFIKVCMQMCLRKKMSAFCPKKCHSQDRQRKSTISKALSFSRPQTIIISETLTQQGRVIDGLPMGWGLFDVCRLPLLKSQVIMCLIENSYC